MQMKSKKRLKGFWWLALPLLLLGCSPPRPNIVYEIVSVRVSATAGPTGTPIASPTLTATATPTPTPTATALPILVEGNPRSVEAKDPVPQQGAPCGLVDTLDFPLDPPDGLRARGGGDFAVFRGRYDKYHTGEDWGLSGRSNFGAPVYSIGHGQITYAAPNGWGADQGVVIIRHVFRGGRSVLSFYGHLDPPSISLRAGQCIRRGDPIGEIGRPRTPPHLHFEIRTHLANTPGPGYWELDPLRAGWLPPSAFIWEQRLISSPGVQWVHGQADRNLQGLGFLKDGLLAVLDDSFLSAIATSDGSLQWTRPVSSTVEAGLLDLFEDQIYLADRMGSLQALRPDGNQKTAWTTHWEADLGRTGTPHLMPLPEGGVVVWGGEQLTAFSASGASLWRQEAVPPPIDWTVEGGELLFTTGGSNGSLWAADKNGPQILTNGLSGRLLAHGGNLWVLEPEAVFKLNRDGRAPERLFELPLAYRGHSDFIGLADGGVLIAHVDLGDRRLIALNADGSLRWERSFAALAAWQPQLISLQKHDLLTLQNSASTQGGTLVFSIDLDRPQLTLVFSGGTRTPRPQDTWVAAAEDDLLILNIGGGALTGVALNETESLASAGTSP